MDNAMLLNRTFSTNAVTSL